MHKKRTHPTGYVFPLISKFMLTSYKYYSLRLRASAISALTIL